LLHFGQAGFSTLVITSQFDMLRRPFCLE
jgi:hypothetical protein